MSRWLVQTTGAERGARFPLPEGESTIGRDSGNEVVIADPQISRHHAVVTVAAGMIQIRDLGSTNGTFVNGQRVTTPRALRPGDGLRLGQVHFAFEEEAPTPFAPPPAERTSVLASGGAEPLAASPAGPLGMPSDPAPPPASAPAVSSAGAPLQPDAAYARRVMVAAVVLVALIAFVLAVLLVG